MEIERLRFVILKLRDEFNPRDKVKGSKCVYFWVWDGNLSFQISRHPDAISKAQECRLEGGGGKIPKETMRLERENALCRMEISSHQLRPKQPFDVYVFFFRSPQGSAQKTRFLQV